MPHQLGLPVWTWASEPGGLPVLPALFLRCTVQVRSFLLELFSPFSLFSLFSLFFAPAD